MKRQFIRLEWLDAWQDQENFATAHGIAATHEPMKVETYGWLIQDDDVGVSVANEKSSQDGMDVFRGRTFVPRAMVKTLTPLTLAKARTTRRAAQTETPPTESTQSETPS